MLASLPRPWQVPYLAIYALFCLSVFVVFKDLLLRGLAFWMTQNFLILNSLVTWFSFPNNFASLV